MTVGEIMVAPLGSVVAAGLARTEDNFGKYMAAQDLIWTFSSGLGSILGGLFFDVGRPMLLWPVCATLVVLSFFGFLRLGRRLPADVERPGARAAPPASAPGPSEA
jgi:predicted MFS family arabinose efflux permease